MRHSKGKGTLAALGVLGLELFVLGLSSMPCVAQEGASGGRDVDLTAADGVKLKATYYAAANGTGSIAVAPVQSAERKTGMTWPRDLLRRESMS